MDFFSRLLGNLKELEDEESSGDYFLKIRQKKLETSNIELYSKINSSTNEIF